MKRYNFTNPLFLFKIESMMRRCFFLLSLLFFVGCNDGDILTVELDFDKDLDRCNNDVNSYLLYDTRTDPNESLTLVIPRNEDTENYFINPTEGTLTINQSTVRFNYRTYNANPAGSLCDVLSNPDLIVTENYEADTGTVYITSTIVDDDNDGIPSIDEYGPGGIENPQDSDGDGIPDYLDQDDDNDNVLTSLELLDDLDEDGDGDPLTNILDTDGDEVPNYLDNDDDGDGIPTKLEDTTGNRSPRNAENYVTNEEGIDVYRYLYNHPSAMEPFEDSGFISNTFTRVVTTAFRIEDINLEIIRATVVDFGSYISTYTITQD